MRAYIFPGQGSQFPGMGKNLFESSTLAKERFIQANEILGFDITKTMFGAVFRSYVQLVPQFYSHPFNSQQ